jgi:hypothetical protein
VGVSAYVTAAIGAIGALFAGEKKLRKHSETVNNFANNHPVLSFAVSVAAALGVLSLGRLGLQKLGQKYFVKNAEKEILKCGEKLNNSARLNKLGEKASKLTGKVHPAIKSFAKGVLDWSPWLLLGGHIAHAIDHASVKQREAAKNYNQLKEMQMRLALAREAELKKV